MKTRGSAWAEEMGTSDSSGASWDSDALRTVALLKVRDLARDPRLLHLLAQELLEAAHERWTAHHTRTWAPMDDRRLR